MAIVNSTEKIHSSADYRRLQLINATIQSIEFHGLSKTTVSKVAKIANLSQGIVNFYFKSKDHLLLNTLEHISNEYNQELDAVFSSASDPCDILKSVIEVSFDPKLCNTGKAVVWYAFWGESQARNEYLSICGKHDQQFRERLIELFNLLIIKNKTRRYNSVAIARGFEGLIDDLWQEHLINPDSFDHLLAKRICLDYLDAFFIDQFNSPDCEAVITDEKPLKLNDNQKTSNLLAPWTYYNDEFFELEKEIIFKKNWLLVGHSSDIPEIGDYLTFDAVGERALVIKSANNQMLAFHNVCRHRGAKVAQGYHGNCPRALVCPFHGWSYNLDGSVRHIPRFETFSKLNKDENGLVKLPLEIWHGFIFINFTAATKSLAEIMAGVDHKLIPYNLEDLKPLKNTKYCQQRPYNWKIIHDIDNEGYHVPIGHPSLQQLYGIGYEDKIENNIPMSYGKINEKPGKLWSVKNYQKILPRFSHLPEENQRLWLYTGIFPSMVIGFYPDMVEFYMSIPKSAYSSEYRGGAYALPDTRREAKLSRYLTQRINRSTEQEDETFVSSIQQGIRSGVFPKLQLSSLEHGVGFLHKKIQQCIPVATLEKPPEQGKVELVNKKLSAGL